MNKYDRRRALDCKLLKKSDSHKGYCKYIITIGEKDGTIHKQPVYGKDMQDALSRVIKKELTVKIEKKLENNTGFIFLAWLLLMGTPAIFLGAGNTPWILVYTFGTIIMLMAVAAIWYNHINKGE
tara:strand:+ start:183 stop:557 length:375 start_codon:yes stop_codon:yes gene_type:complete